MKSKGITVLMINIICVKLFLVFPRTLVINSGSGAWLQMLLVSVLAYLVFRVSMRIYRVCGLNSVIDIGRKWGGNFAAYIIGIILFCVLGANIGIMMRIFPESVKMFLLPDTELEYIALVFLAAAAFGAYMGLDALVNLMAITVFPAAAVLIVFFVSLVGEFDLSNISPVFGNGIPEILKGWNALSIFSDIILFNLFLSEFNDYKEAEKAGRRAIAVSGAIGLAITLAYTLIYPYPISGQILMPVYRLVRSADVVGIFRRMESVLAFVWCILTFISSSVYVYEMAVVIKKSFSLENHKMLILPSAVIISAVGLVDINIVDVLKNERILGAGVYICAVALPVLTAAVYMIRERRKA